MKINFGLHYRRSYIILCEWIEIKQVKINKIQNVYEFTNKCNTKFYFIFIQQFS